MKKLYFFVHIPKTAGTSFRLKLQENESVRMLYDYGVSSEETSEEILSIDPKLLTDKNKMFYSDKINFICGHVSYGKYAHCVNDQAVISVVRNPIERLISEFQHLKRHAGYEKSFVEFVSSDSQQNKQSKMLRGMMKDGGGMIGLTSHYRYFLEVFSEKSGLSVKEVSVNRAPESDSKDRFTIPAKEIKSAYQLNDKDIKFFMRKAQAFSKAVHNVGYNIVPPKNTKWSTRIDARNRLVGWVSCAENDCYFMTVSVNNEPRVVISLDQNRADIFEKDLSENPVCGFSYSLSLLGVEKGDVISVGFLGDSGLAKELIMESDI